MLAFPFLPSVTFAKARLSFHSKEKDHDQEKTAPIECRLRPNYTKKCVACGHGPVVDVYTRDGHFVNSTAMCGACSFGKEKYADPQNW